MKRAVIETMLLSLATSFLVFSDLTLHWGDFSRNGNGHGTAAYAAFSVFAFIGLAIWALNLVFSRIPALIHKERKRQTELQQRFRQVTTMAEGDTIKVVVSGGDYLSEPLVHGTFPVDDEEGLTNCLTKARKDAEEYKERVIAAERLSRTLNGER